MSAEGRGEEGGRWRGRGRVVEGKREGGETYFGLDDQSIEESNPASTAPVMSDTPVRIVVRAVPQDTGRED